METGKIVDTAVGKVNKEYYENQELKGPDRLEPTLVEEKQGKKNSAALRLKRGERLDKIKGT